jgi:hypothetical protein
MFSAHAIAYNAAHMKIRSAVIVDEKLTPRQLADRALERLELYMEHEPSFDSIEITIRRA